MTIYIYIIYIMKKKYLKLKENKKKIHITESQYMNIFENMENEIRTENPDGTVEIDNFDLISSMMNEDQNGDKVYFCQIVRRQKDNPQFYYAYNAADYLTYYLFHSSQELLSAKDEIKTICKKFNARAMFYLNPRSASQVNNYVNNVLLPKLEGIRGGERTPDNIARRNKDKSLEKYRSEWGHEEEIAYGESKDNDLKFPGRDICHVDVDSDDPQKIQTTIDLLKKAGVDVIIDDGNNTNGSNAYRSMNNGLHVICPDKNQVRGIDFSVVDKGVYMGRWASVSVEIDKSVLLYALATPNGYDIQNKIQDMKYQAFLKTGNRHQEHYK